MKPFHVLFYIAVLALVPCSAFSQQWETLDSQVETLQAESKFAESLSISIKSIDIAERQHGVSSREYHKSLKNIADSYMMLAKWAKATEYYKELLRREISRLAEINVNMSATIQSITGLYDLLHDQNSAASVYRKATERLSQIQGVDNSVYTQLSDYYVQALSAQPAPTPSQSLEMVAKQTGTEISSMQQIASQDGSNLIPSNGKKNKDSLPELINNCAQNRQYSNFTGGIQSCKKLYNLQKTKELQHTIEHARTCFDLGYFYMLTSKYSDSIDYYLEGIDLWEKNNFPENDHYIEALYSTSGSLQIKKRYKEAKALLVRAERSAKKLESREHSLYPGILAMLASIQRMDGEYRAAEKSYDKYRDYYLAMNNSEPAVWMNYYLGAGLNYEQLGKWKEADRVYLAYNQATIDLINELFKYVTISSEKKVAQSFVSFRYNQDFFYSYCNKRKDQNPDLLSQMYNNELLTKGLVLRTLRKLTERIYKSADPVIIENFERWMKVRKNIAKLTLLPVGSRKVNLDDLENQIKQLENKLMAWILSNPQNEKLDMGWRDVQGKLHKQEAAIEFIKFQEFDLLNQRWNDRILYGAMIIKPDSSYPFFINLFEEEEFRNFLLSSSDANPLEQVRKMYTWLPGEYDNIYQGDILYKLVWKGLVPHLKGVKKIYYSPTGLLHKISFDAVPVNKEETLVKKHSLQRLTSTGLLADKKTDFTFTKSDKTLLLGGMLFDLTREQLKNGAYNNRRGNTEFIYTSDSSFDWTRSKSSGTSWLYLSGSLDEVNRIGDILETQQRSHRIVTGPLAREEELKKLSGKSYEIIHIATHGFFLPIDRTEKSERLVGIQMNKVVDPDETFKRSGLLFAGANAAWQGKQLPAGLEDGILTAYEISKLNLAKTKLVILSACETGLGDIDDAEGVYGLQRAFKLAGVDNIIMSLWQIPDTQTAELMDIFYSEWLEGQELRQAFHTAQQRMSEKYEPYFWGAFVLLQ